MKLEYVPLLSIMRELHSLPRGRARFEQYLRTIFPRDNAADQLLPLIAMNPMGKEHVTALLDGLLAMDADAVAGQASAEAAEALRRLPGDFKVGLVIADDLKGGWTNRYASEFTFRFGRGLKERPERPRWLKDLWITAVLWSSEPASEAAVRQAVLSAAYRLAYVQEHGQARNLRAMLAQEGHVMARAGCTGPQLDPEDLAYTREVLVPFLDAEDTRTCIECLFGDAAGRTLGFTPRGLSPWAGLALALYDARD